MEEFNSPGDQPKEKGYFSIEATFFVGVTGFEPVTLCL
jgi:hypothetical protein